MNVVDDPLDAKRDREAARALFGVTACFAAIALPWLNPFSGGPSAQVVPWLVSLFAGAVLCAAAGMRRLPLPLLAAGAGATAWVAIRGHGGLDFFAFAGGIGLVLVAAACGASVARRDDALRAVAWGWVVAAAGNALIALAQHQGFLQNPGDWFSAALPGEAMGNLRQRNLLASHLSLGLIALAWLFARGMRTWVALPLVVLLTVASAASTSRTGLLQIVLLAAFSVALPGPRRGQRIALCLTGLTAYAAATFGLPWLLDVRGLPGGSLFERMANLPTCSSRTTLWSNVLTLITRRPWLGWGWGELDYAHYAELFNGPRFCDILDNAHNLPLHVAVELGVPAAVIFIVALARAVLRARPWRETDGARRMAWAMLAALALHSLVEYPLWYGPFQIATGVAIGVLCARDAQAVRPVMRAAWTLVLMALATYASWDFWRVGQVYLPAEARAPAYAHNTLARIGHSWLYRDQVRFAALTTGTLDAVNAERVHALAQEMLHFSPEARVIERAIESARLLGRQEEVVRETQRYRAAFPKDYAAWVVRQAR